MASVSETRLAGVLASVDDRADEIVAFAAELIRQPSVNPDLEPNPLAERPAQEWLRDRLEESQAFDIVDSWDSRREQAQCRRREEGIWRRALLDLVCAHGCRPGHH